MSEPEEPAAAQTAEKEPPAKKERLEFLVQTARERLRLNHWQIRCTLVESRSHCSADIQIDRYRRHAMIRMNDDEPEELWNWYVIHELLHLVTEPLENMVAAALERVPASERPALEAWRKETLEPMICDLTSAILGQPYPAHPNMLRSWRLVE